MTQLAITAIGLIGLLCTIGAILGLCWLAADLAVDGVRWARRRVRRGPSAVRSAGQVEDIPEVVPAIVWPAECPWRPEVGHAEMRRVA